MPDIQSPQNVLANNVQISHSKKGIAMCPGKKILLIDDDVELCETFCDVLQSGGHDVHVLHSGSEAFRLVSRIVPDVVILDMHLPGISGILVLSHIRHMSRLAHTSIIIVSGYADLASTAKTVWGADLYLPKPVTPKELLEAINSVSDGRPSPSL